MDKAQAFQITELQKLSYEFYELLARGKEPLTYTFMDESGNETQVEVNAKLVKDADGVVVHIDFDTKWEGRWRPTKAAQSYFFAASGTWSESSFDGSEFAK